MKDYILVTGASSGLGRAVAQGLSGQYGVIIHGRDSARLAETMEGCNGGEVLVWKHDLTDTEGIDKSLGDVLPDKKYKVVGFVHCAGMMEMVPAKVYSTDAFEREFRVNIISAALIVKFLSSRKHNGKNLRSVVMVSSNISVGGAEAFGVYGASKAGLDGLMRSLAVELAPSVRVNSVLPGGMATAMTGNIFENESVKKSFESNYPLGIGNPDKVAPVIRFLLSEDAGWITGQQVIVDGGRTVNLTEK